MNAATLLNAALMNAIATFLLFAFVCVVLYGVWVWLSTRHFIPVLIRAMQFVEWRIDYLRRETPGTSNSLTAELAKGWLKEIRQYQNRLWLFGPNFNRYRWERTLDRLSEVCTDVINAKDI